MTQTVTESNTNAHTNACMHTQICTRACTHTSNHAHTCTHTCMHAHTQRLKGQRCTAVKTQNTLGGKEMDTYTNAVTE